MITSLVLDLSGIASYTDGTHDNFHGSHYQDQTYSSTGVEGYRASDNIRWDTTGNWHDILNVFFVYLSWSLADFQLNATAQSTRKTLNDMVVRFIVKCTTDGNNNEADLVGTKFEVASTYQLGRRQIHNLADSNALLNEITRDPAGIILFQAVMNAALENVALTIAP